MKWIKKLIGQKVLDRIFKTIFPGLDGKKTVISAICNMVAEGLKSGRGAYPPEYDAQVEVAIEVLTQAALFFGSVGLSHKAVKAALPEDSA